MKLCKSLGCEKKNHAHGFCSYHLWRQPEVREKTLALQRERRATQHNKVTKKYEKTKNGFLMRTYRNMLSRVSGIQAKKAHLYADKEILSKVDFYAFSHASKEFHRLFQAWEESGYCRRLTPSIDRIDSARGYIIDNMQWLTHSENSRKAARKG